MKNTPMYDGVRALYRQWAVKHYKTRFSPKDSARYWDYWKQAQRAWKRNEGILPGPVVEAAENFRLHRFCTYNDAQTICLAKLAKAHLGNWFDQQPVAGHQILYTASDPWAVPGVRELFSGDLKILIEEMMGSAFKLLYGIAVRSIPVGEATPGDGYNSYLWHADGGPPTCINMMFCLDDTDEDNGALELAPNDLSVRLLMQSVGPWRKLNQIERTQKFTAAMNTHKQWVRSKVPAGSLVFFSNNLLHKGGLARGRSRDVLIFHLYPSQKPFVASAIQGIKKTVPIPEKPEF